MIPSEEGVGKPHSRRTTRRQFECFLGDPSSLSSIFMEASIRAPGPPRGVSESETGTGPPSKAENVRLPAPAAPIPGCDQNGNETLVWSEKTPMRTMRIISSGGQVRGHFSLLVYGEKTTKGYSGEVSESKNFLFSTLAIRDKIWSLLGQCVPKKSPTTLRDTPTCVNERQDPVVD